MVAKRYVPHTGDIVWIDLNPARGHEQSKLRPALVISPKPYNQKTSLALVCPVTSQIKGYPFEVAVKHKKIEGVILVDQIRSLDWVARKAKYIGSVPESTMTLVRQKIQPLIQS